MVNSKRGISTMMFGIFALCLCLILSLSLCLPSRMNAFANSAGKLTACSDLKEITDYGSVNLVSEGRRILRKDLENAGIEYGDRVKVSFLDKTLEMPVAMNFNEVDVGSALMRIKDDAVQIAINMGDFASEYIADKTDTDESIEWNYKEGIDPPVVFTIELIQKGKASGDGGLVSLVYTDERSDYPDLSDEEFANFRMVTTSGIGEGALYRTSSPLNAKHNRSIYADNALKEAGVATVINLVDSQKEAEAFDGYKESYYSTCDSIALNMGMMIDSDSFKDKLAKGLRFMSAHEAPYAVHCQEGKDRTGIVAALLECFMGASWEEIEQDYMVTFYNYYGIKPGDAAYHKIAERNIMKSLCTLFKIDHLENADLVKAAEDFFSGIGVTKEEMEKLRTKLGQSCIMEKAA